MGLYYIAVTVECALNGFAANDVNYQVVNVASIHAIPSQTLGEILIKSKSDLMEINVVGGMIAAAVELSRCSRTALSKNTL